MLKVLIAEDETLIRERLKVIVPWEELGYHIVAEAEDGQEALEYLENIDIDVIILDIKMPFLTGIDILKHIFDGNKKIKVILATGHDKFEYAKKALDYGAIGYLLKPIHPDDLTEILIKTKAIIDEEKQLEQQALFRAIKYNKSTIESLFSTTSFEYVEGTVFYIALLKDLTPPSLDNPIHKILHYLKKYGINTLLLDQTKEISFLFMSSNIGNVYEILERILSIEMKSYIIRAYVSAPCPSYSKLNESYIESLKTLESGVFFQNKIVLSYEFMINEQDITTSFDQLVQYCYDIELAFNTQNTRKIQQLIETLFEHINKSNNIVILKKILLRFYFMFQARELIDQDPQVFIDQLLACPDGLTCIKKNIYDRMEVYIRDIKSPNALIVIKIKKYIEDNYAQSTLSTDVIATYFSMNTSYISSVFKKTLDISITEYITKCRMEKAKILLEENKLKVYEIATLVGYSNAFYFSNRFKRYYGLSPKNFIDNKE